MAKKYPIIPPPLPFWKLCLHIMVNAIGWVFFGYFFYYGIIYGKPQTLQFISSLFILFMIVVPLLSFAWILYNINIFKLKGARKEMPEVTETYDKDFLGTPVIADWEKLKKAKKIVITIDENGKHYTAE